MIFLICRKYIGRLFLKRSRSKIPKRIWEYSWTRHTARKNWNLRLKTRNQKLFLQCKIKKTLGVLKINTGNAETESGLENSLEIQRIYILKESKGLGIGTVFMNLAEKKARELGVSFIWLGVWEKNFPAQKFYTNKGFRRFSEHAFVLGDDIQTDFLMKKELSWVSFIPF